MIVNCKKLGNSKDDVAINQDLDAVNKATL